MVDDGATEHQHMLGKCPQGIHGIDRVRISVLDVVALVKNKVCKFEVALLQ